MNKFLFVASVCLLSISCDKGRTEAPQEQVAADEFGLEVKTDPFKDLGIRSDGYYKEERSGVIYLIRFFPNGNAVLINGLPETSDDLPSYLTADAIGDPGMGWYNVPVTIREDSLFFTTYPYKGEISYRGNVPSTSSIRLLRHSHINGERTIKEYVFQPDGTERTVAVEKRQDDLLQKYRTPILVGIALILIAVIRRIIILLRRNH